MVLPLIQAEVVPPGWLTNEQFIAGYGTAQAVPGPLFTFAAYLGAVMRPWPNGWTGAARALGAVFLPSSLLIIGGLIASVAESLAALRNTGLWLSDELVILLKQQAGEIQNGT